MIQKWFLLGVRDVGHKFADLQVLLSFSNSLIYLIIPLIL